MTLPANRVQMIALLFSIAVHVSGAGVVLLYLTDTRKASHTAPVDVRQLTIELIQAESKVEPEPIRKPEPVKKTETATKTVSKPVIKTVATAKSIPKIPIKHKTEKKPQSKSSTKPVRENIQRQKNIASSSVKASENTLAKVPLAEPQNTDYFSLLQARIESRKYYPRSARKQGIEGSVDVSFRLFKDGEVRDISTTGAHRLLNHAASQAIKKSLPFPAAPDSIVLPKTIHFSMHYDLKR
jgi:protein TonB